LSCCNIVDVTTLKGEEAALRTHRNSESSDPPGGTLALKNA
jgi:hypothetical protein